MKINLSIIAITFLVISSGCGIPSSDRMKTVEDTTLSRNAENKVEVFYSDRKIIDKNSYSALCMKGYMHLENALIRQKRGDSLGYNKEIKDSLDYYRKAIQVDKEKSRAHKELYMVHKSMENNSKALNSLLTANEKDPNDFYIKFMLGNFYDEKGDLDNALIWLTQADNLLSKNAAIASDKKRREFKKYLNNVRERKKDPSKERPKFLSVEEGYKLSPDNMGKIGSDPENGK